MSRATGQRPWLGRGATAAPRVEAGSARRLQRPPGRQDDQETHACTCEASSVVRPCWICDIGWWIAVGPIVFLAQEVRPGMRVHERREVKRLAVRERAGRVERHVATDE